MEHFIHFSNILLDYNPEYYITKIFRLVLNAHGLYKDFYSLPDQLSEAGLYSPSGMFRLPFAPD
ncbi:hypothetical protein BBEV_2191 [Salisediminibacterium beveridgei]|uniref:Uncharacterized protein n=1 Tax=Salisediminibacterium beveridgei TaxID=632773 RepID=A0A1D7QX45_9BACI|nr:hypothetical protein BBEV_2191 [Salisediminibacterium beveridgei]